MTNIERSTHPSSSMPCDSSGGAHAADALTDDVPFQAAAAVREVKANIENVIADAGERSQQALNYAGQKGREAMDNAREVGEPLQGRMPDHAVVTWSRMAERWLRCAQLANSDSVAVLVDPDEAAPRIRRLVA